MLLKKSALIIASSLLAMGVVHAAPPAATANLNVNIYVTASSAATSCALSNYGMPIAVNPSYTSGATAAAVFSGGSLTVTCNGTDAVAYSIGANGGNNPSATSRRALFAGNFVDYQLHLSNMMMPGTVGAIWDEAIPLFSGSVITGTTSPSGASSTGYVNFTSKVAANQTAASGTYIDVVVLTATF